MNITIDKSFIGTEKNLLLSLQNENVSYSWTDSKEYFHLKDENSTFNKLLAVISEDLSSILPPQKYIRMMNTFGLQDEIIPWGNILSDKDKKEYNKKIITHISNIIKNINQNNLNYFNNILKSREESLNTLTKYYLDEPEVEKILSTETNKSINSTIKAFYESNDRIVKYDNFGSKTGRLTIKNNLNILTLKKEYRKIFKSSFGENGSLISIDFSSLELRLLLLEAERYIKNIDIYQKISDSLKGILDREQVKKLLISFIYGASNEKLASICEADINLINKIVDSLKRNLNIDNLLNKIKSNIKNNKIENKFGRLIKLDNEFNDDGLILNYYIQSLGADFSLITFYDFIKSTNIEIKPVFFIHDSLIFDIENKNIEYLNSIQHLHSSLYNIDFPVKLSYFSSGIKI